MPLADPTARAKNQLKDDATSGICYICGYPSDELHHTSYYPEETVPLCVSCHHNLHNYNEPRELLPDISVRPDNYDAKRSDGVNSLEDELAWNEGQL